MDVVDIRPGRFRRYGVRAGEPRRPRAAIGAGSRAGSPEIVPGVVRQFRVGAGVGSPTCERSRFVFRVGRGRTGTRSGQITLSWEE
jgi:hypothetical protein